MIKLIVAIGQNGLIGNGDKLPWHISEEFKHFKNKTLNSYLLMGKNTFYSLPQKLKNRFIYVLSNDDVLFADKTIKNEEELNELLNKFRYSDEILYIAGGKSIYEQFYQEAIEIIISEIHDFYEGNVFLNLDLKNYRLDREEKYEKFDVKYFIKVF